MKRAFRRSNYTIKDADIPQGWSKEAAAFINSCLS